MDMVIMGMVITTTDTGTTIITITGTITTAAGYVTGIFTGIADTLTAMGIGIGAAISGKRGGRIVFWPPSGPIVSR